MKATYTAPEQEIVKFAVEDVITTSSQSGMTDAGGNNSWDDNDKVSGGGLFG